MTMQPRPNESDLEHQQFLDGLDEALGSNTARPVSAIGALMARFNAAVTHPQTQTIGDFAGMLQGISAELNLMGQAAGYLEPGPDTVVDWAAILAAADASGTDEALLALTDAELAAMGAAPRFPD